MFLQQMYVQLISGLTVEESRPIYFSLYHSCVYLWGVWTLIFPREMEVGTHICHC